MSAELGTASGSVGTAAPSSSTERTATTRSTPSAWTGRVVTSPRRTTLASSSWAARRARTDPAAVTPGGQLGLQLDDGADLLAGRVQLDLQRLVERIGGVGEDRHAVRSGGDAVAPRALAAGLLERPQQSGVDAPAVGRGRAGGGELGGPLLGRRRPRLGLLRAAAASRPPRGPAPARFGLVGPGRLRRRPFVGRGALLGRRLQRRRGAGQLGGLLARRRLGGGGQLSLGGEAGPR